MKQEVLDVVEHPSHHVGEILCLGALTCGAALGGKALLNVARLAAEEKSAQLAIDALPDLLHTPIPSNMTQDAVEMRLGLDIGGGIKRALTVHIPPGFNAEVENPVLVGFDSTQMGRPAGALNKINGLGDASDKYGFLSVFPEQAPRARLAPLKWAGKSLTSWNAEGLPIKYQPGLGNDLQFASRIADAMPKVAKVDPNRFVFAGFSDGGWLVNKYASSGEKLPISGIASISGSISKADALPQSGLKALIVGGTEDLNFPASGGAGKNTKMLTLFGHTNINESAPALQVQRYATANGLTDAPATIENEVYVQRDFTGTQPGQASVREFQIKGGGHTWHGRNLGQGTESNFSPKNGRPLPSSIFSTNEQIVRYFDLGNTIKRTVAA